MIQFSRLRNIAAVAGCLWLVSCGTSKKVTLEEVVVSAKDEVYRPAADKVWDITHTKVALSFNFKEKTANGRAWLDLHPYFYATDSLNLDAKGMKIDSVQMVTNTGSQPLKFTYGDNVLKLEFGKAYTAQDNIRLYIVYTAMPYAEPPGGGKAISEDRGLYFINTDNAIPRKPMQIWTQGEPEANAHWMPTIDKPNERFTTEISLTVPDSFTTLGNGRLVSQAEQPGGMRTDTWAIDKEIQAYAVMFAIGKYAVVKDEWRGKEVSYYVEPEYEPYARKMFDNTPEMMEYYSAITGITYPWNKYAQVVVRDYVSGAMENTTASIYGEFINQDFRQIADKDYEYIVAHELFHQWFGDYVTAESWANITVNESFANYGEILWFNYKYGKTVADKLARDELWNYLYGQAETNDAPLVRFHYKTEDDVFDRISYQKGGAILRYMHGIMGDAAFFKAMNLYLTKHALQSAEAAHWRLAVEEVTGQDWNWFFDQWYYKGGHPELDIKHSYNDDGKELTVTVTQKQQGSAYRLPLKTWLVYGDSITVVDWDIRKKQEIFTYPYKSGQKPWALADAEHWLVGEIHYNFTPSEWLRLYQLSSNDIVNKRLSLTIARENIADSSSQAIFELAMKDTMSAIRQLVLVNNISRLKGSKWKDKWKDNVWQMARKDRDNLVRAYAFNLLGQWEIKEARQDMLDALDDSSYSVAGAALDAFNNVAGADKDTAYIIAKEMLDDDPKGDLRSVIWRIIAKKGSASDADLFAEKAWEFYGPYKIELAYAMSQYLQYVTSPTAFDKVLNTFVNTVNSESISSYRLSAGAYLFETAGVYKKMVEDSRTNPEQADMQGKFDKLKTAIDKVMAAEKNENNLKQYRNYKKVIFG